MLRSKLFILHVLGIESLTRFVIHDRVREAGLAINETLLDQRISELVTEGHVDVVFDKQFQYSRSFTGHIIAVANRKSMP